MFLKRLGIVLAALIPVAIVGAFVFQSNDEETVTTVPATNTATTTPTTPEPSTATSTATTTDSAPTTTDAPQPTPDSASSSMYEDGTYTAEGPYTSPAGSENITVTLTVISDVVTHVDIVTNGVGASALWQGKFVSGVDAVVVGKKLSELKLTNVSGSSLTPIGFNAAVESIKAQAEA